MSWINFPKDPFEKSAPAEPKINERPMFRTTVKHIGDGTLETFIANLIKNSSEGAVRQDLTIDGKTVDIDIEWSTNE